MVRRKLFLLLIAALLFAGCAARPEEPDWLAVNDFLYQLQQADSDRIGETAFDLVVVTLAAAGSSPDVIPALRNSPGGPKIILCYMSIGQSETYRWYWDPDWNTNPPDWLDVPDGIWAGDHWVRYWDPAWQQIIYGTPESYLDQILALGFDGVYLDRVDAYWYYQDQGRETAAGEMVDFILAFSAYARERHPGFGVFPQNAEELGILFPEFMDVMTGIGVEDLYYGYPRDHAPSPPEWTAAREAILDQWVAAGKLVLTIDYTARPEQIADAYFRSYSHSYVPYVTDRSLGRLRINPGFEPDKAPSEWDFPAPTP
ncbi:MAG: endo alpha-1,4 polygalactosaminidase [Anaerolineales bacterium]|nr:endo alpha-1,4 polygalactosaminidase [Anaerolineales bacterium]